jgi:tetratricopeptide (TPR) repeat protein
MTELALGMIERAEEIIRRSGDMAGLASSYINKGILYMTMGRLKESKEILSQAVEISRELGHRRWLTSSLAQLAGACNLIGEYSDGERYANESVSIAKRAGDTPGVIDARNHQGYSLICQGKKEQGIKVLKQNVKDARSLGKHQMAIEGLRALAEGYLRLRDARNARLFAEQAIAIAKERRFAAELKTMEKVMKRIEALGSARKSSQKA